jgi:glycosyltransferase involved in cell wall biosynthesis
MTSLRSCMLATFYPPYSFGGDAIGLQRLARGLVRRGHHVTVVHDVDAYNALHTGPEPAEETDAGDGVDVIRLRSGYGILSPILTQQLGRPALNRKRLRDILRPGTFDVVNFHNVSLIGGPGLFRYGSDAVRVYMAHEHWLVCPTHVLWRHNREVCTGRQCIRCALRYRRPPQYWRYTGLLERESRHVDAFIAMSEFSRQKHREFGFQREMEVLPYFLPDPGPGDAPSTGGPRPQERPYFLFVGRLERIKGLDDVIPVFRDFPAVDLLIAGDGEYGDVLRAEAAGMANVGFLGRVPPEQLRRYYQHAVATLVPSLCYETFGIVLIEAFRQGTPVIARRLGPLPEIVAQSGAGEIFDSRESLRAAMRRLVDDPAHRDRLAENGYRAYVDRWSESVVVPHYLDIVRRAAERRGHLRVTAALAAVSAA